MNCSACGAPLSAQAQFCSQCGQAVVATAEFAHPEHSAAEPPVSPAAASPAAANAGVQHPDQGGGAQLWRPQTNSSQVSSAQTSSQTPAAAMPAPGTPGGTRASKPTAMITSSIVRDALLPAAIGVGVAAVVSALLMSVWAGVFSDEVRWSLVGVFKASLLTLSLAFGGMARLVQTLYKGSEYSYHWSVVPTLVTSTALIVTFLASAFWRRRRRAAADTPAWVGLVAAVVGAATVALVLCIAAAMASWTMRQPLEESLSSSAYFSEFDLSSRVLTTAHFGIFVWTWLAATVLLSTAAVLGQLWVSRNQESSLQPEQRAQPLADRVWRSWAPHLGTLGVWLLAGLACGAIVVLVLWLRGDEKLQTLVLFLPVLPSALLYGWAFLLGMNPSMQEVASYKELESQHTDWGLLYGEVSAWLAVLLLIPLLVTVLVGVRAGLRQATRGRWPQGWWQLMLLMLWFWLAAGLITRVNMSVESGYDSAQDQSFSLTLGSLLLMALVWALVLLAVQAWLTELVVRHAPAVAKLLGGRAIAPAWQEQLAGAPATGRTTAAGGPVWPPDAGGPGFPSADPHPGQPPAGPPPSWPAS